MTTRFAAAWFALALPLCAQAPTAAPAENLFYQAYWLENGERDLAQAIVLYEKFLDQAPEHRLAAHAARFEHALLVRTGKADAAAAFAKKHDKLLGGVVAGKPAADKPADGDGEGGERRPRGERGQRGAPADMEARLAELKKQLADAKAAGDDEQVARLERQIQRMERAQSGEGGGPGGPGGGPGGRGRMAPVEFAKMTDAELEEFKTQRLERMSGMIDRLRENGMDERADQLETAIDTLKKALDAGKKDEAQAAWDKMMEGMRRGRRGDGGGGGGGGREGGGGGGGRGGDGGR